MKELDKAIKTYWYSRGFNKAPDTCGCYQMELDAFSEGYKAALEWAEEQVGNDYCKGYKAIKEELNAKT